MTVPTASRFSRYLTVILRWLSITVAVFFLAMLGGVTITDHLLPKVYTATAQLQIGPAGMTGTSALDPNHNNSIPFQAEFEVMQSPDFLLPIIHDLGLDKVWAKRLSPSKEDQLTPVQALAYIHKILRLDYLRGTNIVNITVSDDLPKEAADIANAIADRYQTISQSPVRIISRAVPPEYPSRPNRAFDYIVTILVAGFLGVMAASFVEVILLFLRASKRSDG